MSWGVGGLVGSALGLIVLEVLVTSTSNAGSGASQLTGLLAVPGKLAHAWLDPSVPLIPDRSGGAAAASSGSSGPPTPTKTNYATGTVAGANPWIVQMAGRGK